MRKQKLGKNSCAPAEPPRRGDMITAPRTNGDETRKEKIKESRQYIISRVRKRVHLGLMDAGDGNWMQGKGK